MDLSRAAALASHVDVPQLAAGHAHSICSLAETAEVNVERTWAVELAERADAVAHTGSEYTKVRLRRKLFAALQLSRRQEPHAHPIH